MIYDVYTIYIIIYIYTYVYIYIHKYMDIYIIHRAQKNNSWTLDSCWSGWMGSRRGAARWIGNWHQLILEEEIQRSKRRASPMAIIFFSGTTSMFPETPLIYIYIHYIICHVVDRTQLLSLKCFGLHWNVISASGQNSCPVKLQVWLST